MGYDEDAGEQYPAQPCALTTLSPPAHGSQVKGCVLRRGYPLLCCGQIARYPY